MGCGGHASDMPPRVPQQVPTGDAGKGPLKPFYWKTGDKNSCQDEPPPGAIRKHPLEGYTAAAPMAS